MNIFLTKSQVNNGFGNYESQIVMLIYLHLIKYKIVYNDFKLENTRKVKGIYTYLTRATKS